MGYATGLLEYSDDPLSDSTPTYIDRSSYVLGDVTWSDGKSRDLDDPQAGTISFRLSNANGEWVPNSADSLYPDSPFLLRRFRWSVNGTAEGVWFVSDWQITYPAGTPYSEVVVTAVDGFELLSLDALDLLDPPTAATYEEVVMADAPFGFYRLDEKAGTAMVAVAGNEGVYKNTPLLAQATQIVGDAATSIDCGENEYGQVLVDTNQFVDASALTLEIWMQVTDASGAGRAMVGPYDTPSSDHIFYISFTTTALNGIVRTSGGAPTTSYTTTVTDLHHVVVTWDGAATSLYVDGVLRHTQPTTGDLVTPDADAVVGIGGRELAPNGSAERVRISNAAFYEHSLSAERVLVHYQAGAERGFNEELAGERIANVADSTLWAETEIEAGEHTVHPVMEHGQSKLDEIRAAVKAEMPDTHFYFDGDGNPVYRAWNYNDGNGVLGTFGPGGISYQGLEPVYDSEIFNEVTVGHEAAPGEEAQHTETDATSEGQFYRRAHSETGLILSEHHDAIAVAAAILEKFKDPQRRFASLTLNGNQTTARAQILSRQIGDLIRVVGVGVNDADIVTTILGRSKTLTAAGHLTCTWTLARGFDAAAGLWQLGIDGFSELGETTVLG